MKDVILQMIERFGPRNLDEYDTALKEVIQRMCLLGLWRAKFFEHAAFYRGTALRLLYGLDRFSEDLDFSLLSPMPEFRLDSYFQALRRELEAFGFETEISEKEKTGSPVAAAFIKSNTRVHRLRIGLPERLARQAPANQLLKVKFELDTDPPAGFATEVRYMLQPVPFSVRVYTPGDLFAGKMHAVLFRKWGGRVKGRDWYDLVWLTGRETPLNLDHLSCRMRQTGHWSKENPVSREEWKAMLHQAIAELDIQAARRDVLPFVQDSSRLEVWSAGFFSSLVDMIQTK